MLIPLQDSFITPTAVSSTQSEYTDVLNLDLDVNSQDEESYLAVNIWQYVSKGEVNIQILSRFTLFLTSYKK